MTVPPYVLSCIGIACGAWLAARTGLRSPFIIGSAVVAILGMTLCSCLRFSSGSNRFLGYIILLATKTGTLSLQLRYHVDLNSIAGAQYVGVHFCTLGVYTGESLILR